MTKAERKRWERWQAIQNTVACLEAGDFDLKFTAAEREQALAAFKAEGAAILAAVMDAHPELFVKWPDGKYSSRERLMRETLKADVTKPN
jgi:hypothetical protein